MDPNQVHEWSRHYDSTQWVVTGILTAAVGGLLIYCYQRFDPILALVGVVFTLMTVFYAASFRSLRRRLHATLPNEDVALLRSRRSLRQWPVHVAVFLALLWLWVTLLVSNLRAYWWVWGAIGVAGTGLMVRWYRAADQLPEESDA